MKVVRTFSTSANLGPGFDTLGICFNLFNDYEFRVNDCYKLVGFDNEYNISSNNLIIRSYEEVFNYLHKDIIYIYLKEKERNIPTSRGLGSSASCIVAGIMIANDVLGNPLSKEEMFQIASSIEGHPDNVAPLIYGGFTCSFRDDIFYKINLNVSKIFKFMVCIPPFELSTSLARSVLPKEVSINKAVFNISHCVALVKALEQGDMDLLSVSKKDLLHEPYRYELIKGSDLIRNYATINGAVCMISGAGSTLLLISDKNIKPYDELKGWQFKEVEICDEGAYIYEK